MHGSVHVIIWRYEVATDRRDDFERAYGPSGLWCELFGRAEGYRSTELVRAADSYLTIDRWESQAAFDRFLDRWRGDYDRLDRELEPLTRSEELVARGTSVAG